MEPQRLSGGGLLIVRCNEDALNAWELGRDHLSSALHAMSDSDSITYSNWRIVASKSHISTSAELDSLHAELGIPLPEMTFGNNSLAVTHLPSDAQYTFNTPAALRKVRAGELCDGDGAVKVDYAETWLSSRCVSFLLTLDADFLH